MDRIISLINDFLSSYILVGILILGGIYFTLRTGFVQIRLFGAQIRSVAERPKDKEGVSSFHALMVSTASRVGTGNIIGVSTAICMGGYGAVFWMWVVAIIGSASAFIESTLAQIYKRKGIDGSYGGPAYYIETGLKSKVLAIVFSLLLIMTYGVGFNMLASFNLQDSFKTYNFYDKSSTPWIIGLATAVLVAYCLFGGGRRIIKATGIIVPIMGTVYILVALFVICFNFDMIPSIFKKIFESAFDFKAIFGGFTGSCLLYGIKRGLFSNEAGVGSAPNASASADVSHPVKQGLVQVLSVFIDTLVVCSATAFLCMSSGVEATKEISGAAYVQGAAEATLGQAGPIFITISLVLFAFTTLLGNLYYVDRCIFYILKREPGKTFKMVYYPAAAALILVGAILEGTTLWNIADIMMAAMTIINIPVICVLGKYAFRALKDYTEQRKAGKDPVFVAKDIGLKDKVDYWN